MLNDRFRRYFNHSYLASSKRGASIISRVLLKYGYAAFRLEILEYCPSSMVLIREQFYFDTLNPEYNILKVAGSHEGYKHSEAAKKLISIAAKTRYTSEEFLTLKREAMLGKNLSEGQLDKMINNNPYKMSVVVMNEETGKKEEFPSLKQAALFLGIHRTTVKRYLMENKPYKGYMITKASSELDPANPTKLTNKNQAVELTNCETGDTKQFLSMQAAHQFLGISSRRLSKYLQDNENSNTKGEVKTIKGYIITKIDSPNSNFKAIEVTNIHTNEIIKYSSVSSASKDLEISQSSISLYLSRKRTTPFKGIYLFKFIIVT